MRRVALLLPCVIVSAVWAAGAQTPVSSATSRRVNAEDYYRVKSVGAPRLSPDGRWVAFTVTQAVEATNATSTESVAGPRPDPAAGRGPRAGAVRLRAAPRGPIQR